MAEKSQKPSVDPAEGIHGELRHIRWICMGILVGMLLLFTFPEIYLFLRNAILSVWEIFVGILEFIHPKSLDVLLLLVGILVVIIGAAAIVSWRSPNPDDADHPVDDDTY